MSVGDRWAIIGATGSGKTVFDRALINMYAIQAEHAKRLFPIYIIDSKMAGDFTQYHQKGFGTLVRGNDVPKLNTRLKKGIFTVWQPEEDSLEMYDAFFKQIYQARQPAIILVDEISNITNQSGSRYPRYFDILLKQGRGLNIGLIMNTQAPSFIPANLIRQATHMLRFTLNSEYDTKKIETQLGREYGKDWNPPDEHGFVYRNLTRPRTKFPTIYYHSMQEFFGLN